MAYQNNTEDEMKAINKQVVTLSDAMKYIAHLELPWPKDVFGEVPKEDWPKIDEFAKTLGYRIDTIAATLERRGWAVHERLVRELLTDLVDMSLQNQVEA